MLPRQASAAGSLVSDEKWTCAPDSHRVTWTCEPLARLFALRTILRLVPTAGFAPTQPRSQRGMLLLHHAGSQKGCGMSVRPRRVEFGYACAIAQTHGVRSSVCIGAARQHRHAAVTSTPQNWPLEWVVRPPLRIFNPPLICLSHPALNKEMVPPRGDAPRSAGYLPAALLLSYRGIWRKGCPHQELHLEPRPLEAAYARLLQLAGLSQKGRSMRALLPPPPTRQAGALAE